MFSTSSVDLLGNWDQETQERPEIMTGWFKACVPGVALLQASPLHVSL